MRVRDLGTLVVVIEDTDRTFGRTKQAVLLSMLALNANRRVSVDELVEAAWGDAEVSDASVDSQIWRLRRALGSGEIARSLLRHDAGGYRLVVEPEQVDSLRFEKLAVSAGRLLSDGEAQRALDNTEEALGLWRGRPYELLADSRSASAAVARLEELYAQTHEVRIDALLKLGQLERALADLEPLLTRMPFREHLWAQRMTALAGAERTEEALRTYADVRALLSEETGLDPGSELQRLHQRVLAHKIERVTPSPSARATAPPVSEARRTNLPRRGTALIGRIEDCARLKELVSHHSTVTVTGPGGTGKTRLVLEVARQVIDAFPDGVWFVDLSAVSDPARVVDVTISTLRLGAVPVIDAVEALTAFTRARRMLILLDNCEHLLDAAADLVDSLQAESTGLAVLATSREPLGLDGEIVWSLSPLPLLPITSDSVDPVSPAARLFLERAAAAAPQHSLAGQLGEVEALCRALDGLPLAIELAAARARMFGLPEILRQVADDPTRLAHVGRGMPSHHASLDATIEWSYRLLEPDDQALHRRLSVLAGPFTLSAAQAAWSHSEPDVSQLLARLTHRSLLVAEPSPTGPSAFSQLATVRAHATNRLYRPANPDEAASTIERRNEWVETLLAERPRLGHRDEPIWFDRLDADYPTIRLALNELVDHGSDPRWLSLGAGPMFFWYFRFRMIEGGRWLQAAIDRWSGRVSPVRAAIARLRMACNLLLRGRPDLARRYIEAELDVVSEPTPDEVEVVEVLAALATSAWAVNDAETINRVYAVMRRLADLSGDPDLVLHADTVGCVVNLYGRDPHEAAEIAEGVYERADQSGNSWCIWVTCGALAHTVGYTGRLERGQVWAARMLERNIDLGEGGAGLTIETLANFSAMAGELPRAARLFACAQATAERAGMIFPSWSPTRPMLEKVQRGLDPATLRDQWEAGRRLSLIQVIEGLPEVRPR